MRIRRDAVFLSSVLFTIAFLLLVPLMWNNAQAGLPFWHLGRAAQADRAELQHMEESTREVSLLLGQCGFSTLIFIFVVLTVIWKAYVKKLQWAWFVMFVVVWVWYFPLFVLPTLRLLRGFDLIKWLASLTYLSSWSYSPSLWVVIHLLMLAALILPVRSFFGKYLTAPTNEVLEIAHKREPVARSILTGVGALFLSSILLLVSIMIWVSMASSKNMIAADREENLLFLPLISILTGVFVGLLSKTYAGWIAVVSFIPVQVFLLYIDSFGREAFVRMTLYFLLVYFSAVTIRRLRIKKTWLESGKPESNLQ